MERSTRGSSIGRRILPILALGWWVGCGDFGEEPFAGPPPGNDNGGGTVAEPDTVRLAPSRDNTLFESTVSQLSNGAGPHLYAGRNSSFAGDRRRALLRFSVADSIPAGAVIDRVELTLNVSQVRETSGRPFGLHRVSTRWGEGASDSGTGGVSHGGGSGAPAAAGDATWTCAVLDTIPWTTAGGDYASAESAVAQVGGLGAHVWASTPDLVADVQAWLDDPASDFGWILMGDESEVGTAKRFDSRENATPAARPVLTVVYTAPAAP